ncbi:hypothetical protein HanIR_Chr16g0795391 [Helianthus annuus]|nr:hypothetical protein HanIR_Chr16g0795391 [Helianthus annuus]
MRFGRLYGVWEGFPQHPYQLHLIFKSPHHNILLFFFHFLIKRVWFPSPPHLPLQSTNNNNKHHQQQSSGRAGKFPRLH